MLISFLSIKDATSARQISSVPAGTERRRRPCAGVASLTVHDAVECLYSFVCREQGIAGLVSHTCTQVMYSSDTDLLLVSSLSQVVFHTSAKSVRGNTSLMQKPGPAEGDSIRAAQCQSNDRIISDRALWYFEFSPQNNP